MCVLLKLWGLLLLLRWMPLRLNVFFIVTKVGYETMGIFEVGMICYFFVAGSFRDPGYETGVDVSIFVLKRIESTGYAYPFTLFLGPRYSCKGIQKVLYPKMILAF